MPVNFALFKNYKKKSENSPDWTGSVKDDQGNVLQYVSGWVKKSKTGAEYISISIKDAEPVQNNYTPVSDELSMSYDDLPY